jgi:hypothetical protein
MICPYFDFLSDNELAHLLLIQIKVGLSRLAYDENIADQAEFRIDQWITIIGCPTLTPSGVPAAATALPAARPGHWAGWKAKRR